MLGPAPNPRQMVDRAIALTQRGEHLAAAQVCRAALRADPANAAALHALAIAERELGDTGEAHRALARVLKARPGDPGALYDLGLTYRREGRLGEAHTAFDRALRAGAAPAILAAKAETHALAGEAQAAWALIAPALAAAPDDRYLAQVFARIAPKLGRAEEAAAALERVVRRPGLPPQALSSCRFLLGDLYDNLKEHDRAFACYAAAQEGRSGGFDPSEFSSRVDAMLRFWTAERLAGLPRSTVRADQALLIVGMPRSGTSLVEQILASHPGVAAGGELNDIGRVAHEWQGTMSGSVALLMRAEAITKPALERAAREYQRTLRRIGPVAERVTDKMPMNFLHLGLVALMLPGVRVVHCVRNPVDTCLSCFFQNFAGSNPFTHDLSHLGRFYVDYHRLMAHWAGVLSVARADVVYEALVADQESATRRLVEFAGLPWDAACLKFHETKRVVMTSSNDQVRRPMYTSSVERWRRYERHLGPLIDALGSLGPGSAPR